MKKSYFVHNIHLSIVIYLLVGGFFQNQREFLVLFLPTLQFQFLVNDNTCVLTQLENKLIEDEKVQDNKKEDDDDDDDKIETGGFIDSKLKEYNIHIEPTIRERAIHSFVYLCFLGNYFYM